MLQSFPRHVHWLKWLVLFLIKNNLKKCVIINELLKSERLKHLVTIVFDQSWSISRIYKNRCLEYIKKVYKSARKCGDQQQYKAIIEAEMDSTSTGFIKNIPMSHIQYVNIIKISVKKSLRRFFITLEVKLKTSVHNFCVNK